MSSRAHPGGWCLHRSERVEKSGEDWTEVEEEGEGGFEEDWGKVTWDDKTPHQTCIFIISRALCPRKEIT